MAYATMALALAVSLSAALPDARSDSTGVPAKLENKAPAWAKPGVYVYRVSTPDEAGVLDRIGEGTGIVYHLMDGSIGQIPILNGIIGDDHRGPCNWDGLWPYWGRVSFRANNDWKYLHDFMVSEKENYKTTPSFHVNLTDVNIGLRQYPETREFFKKLVATRSEYRRDRDKVRGKRDIEPPYVLEEIPADDAPSLTIVALVNYKNFWDSGLAKEMIDDFYGHLPYAPPLLYLDVLTLSGGNFSTGFPTGPLGGSEQTQLEGALKIGDYLQGKGTDIATEGDRPFMGTRATYSWLHGKGYSEDDYSVLRGQTGDLAWQHVAGVTGSFNVSPIASTADGIKAVRDYYAAILAGQKPTKKLADAITYHISDRKNADDEFDIAGAGGDRFRGDWADLVNNFYLVTIQELYHIGSGATRTFKLGFNGVPHLSKIVLTDRSGRESTIPIEAFADPLNAEPVKPGKAGDLMLTKPITANFFAPEGGSFRGKLFANNTGSGNASMNVYINDRLAKTLQNVTLDRSGWSELDLGELPFRAGDNTITVESGPMVSRWNDGTEAVWTTPYLRKGFKVTNGEVTLAEDYDRMWPDTWSGQKKIYFFSWDGTGRTWKLPQDWAPVKSATLYPLTPDGRGKGIPTEINDRNITAKLLPQVPYVLVP